MNQSHQILTRILPVLIFVVVGIVILLVAGQFRSPTPSPETAPETSSESSPASSAETKAETLPETTPAVTDAASFLASLKDRQDLRKLSPAVAPAGQYSQSTMTVQVPVRIPDSSYKGYTTVLEEKTVERPLVSLYMDHILIDKNGSFAILRPDGSLLSDNFDLASFAPAFTRDNTGRPLFSLPFADSEGNTSYSYYYLDDNGTLITSAYREHTDSRFLHADYPAAYASGAGYPRRFVTEYGAMFGASDGTILSPIYTSAYPFSEGLAATVTPEGDVEFVNEAFEKVIAGGEISYHIDERRCLTRFRLPDTQGEESYGFLYFDHGICLARRQILDGYYKEFFKQERIYEDETVVLRKDGSLITMPTDYTVVGASEGMILLEKNGLYGFMDETERWVIQPVNKEASLFKNGYAVIGDASGKVGVVNRRGEFVIPCVFDHIGLSTAGTVAAFDQMTGWSLFSIVPIAQ